MLVFLPFTHGQYSYYLSQPTEAIIPEESIWMNIFCTSQNFCTILMFLFVVYLSVFKSFKKKNRERPRPFAIRLTSPEMHSPALSSPPGFGRLRPFPRTPVPMRPGTGNAPPSSPVTSCPSSSWGRPQNTNSTGWTKPPAAPHKRKAPADFLLPGLLASCLNFEGFPLSLLWKPS